VSANAVIPLDVTPLDYRFANAAANYGIYAGKIFYPLNLAVLYPLPESAPYVAGAISAVVIAILLFLAWRFRDRAPFVLVGFLWFLGTLVPVSGLVQVGKNVLADRFAYVPQIGLFIAVVWSAAAAIRARSTLLRPIVAIGAAAMLCLALRSVAYVRHWEDSASIFTEAAAAAESNYIAHANAGFALAQRGNLEPAIVHYRSCTIGRLWPLRRRIPPFAAIWEPLCRAAAMTALRQKNSSAS
jgi:protein O-mannosyl-transferase